MGAISPATVGLSEFQNLPGDGVQHEVDAGELLTLPPAKSVHSRIARLVSKAIENALDQQAFEMFVEAGYLLCSDPLTIRQPDISVLSKLRLAASAPDSYFDGAPELAVEIVYPSDLAEALDVKVRQYLTYGALEVWVLYPETQNIHVFRSISTVRSSEPRTSLMAAPFCHASPNQLTLSSSSNPTHSH